MPTTATASPAPGIVVFDVNGTLSDLSGLSRRLEQLGGRGELIGAMFTATLRDGFALTASGALADFADIAVPTLAAMLEGSDGLTLGAQAAAEHVVAGMSELDLHPDIGPGMRQLAQAGVRILTLSNGAARVAESLLERAGLRDLVERCLSVSDAGHWKPDPRAYAYALERAGAKPHDVALVAVHPWDIDGARRAGLRTGWISRDARPYPPFFLPPDTTGRGLDELAAAWTTTPPLADGA